MKQWLFQVALRVLLWGDSRSSTSHSGFRKQPGVCVPMESLRDLRLFLWTITLPAFPTEPGSRLLKRTPVKSQAERQPHLWIHCVSRVTVISINPGDVAKKMWHASLGITQSMPGSELWFSPGGEHTRNFTIYVRVLYVRRNYLLVYRHLPPLEKGLWIFEDLLQRAFQQPVSLHDTHMLCLITYRTEALS